jgi:molybdenum cofactor cytidylyltransferase
MQFGPTPLDDAEGAILAHSIVASDAVLKKGRRLTRADISLLRAAGLTSVMTARLAADDVPEDAAAELIASRLAAQHTSQSAPFTGRANIIASTSGIVCFDTNALRRLNDIDERITVASVANFDRVAAGQMLATIKIIPFAVPQFVLAEAERVARESSISVAPFLPHSAGLVITRLPSTKASIIDKRRKVIADRLQSAGSRLAEVAIIDHETAKVAAALAAMAAEGHSPLLVFSASAIVDRDDIVPAALVAAGGRIERLGMPVDPGNLLLLGAKDATPVIGIPSCAASPKLNGFDWVLERTLAGLKVTNSDIAGMAVGGLLKEIPTRPQPRAGGTAATSDGRHAPRVACIILAGGRSTRMGSNKLLEDLDGRPIVRHVVEAARASQCSSVQVIVGHQADKVRGALAGAEVDFVENPNFAKGLSTSMKAGLDALPQGGIDGVFVALGDMPELTAEHLNLLIAAFAPKEGRSIIVPVRHGKRGNPVLWSSAYFDDMRAVNGDTGARHLLGQYADQVTEVDLRTDAVLNDIDTPEALAALRSRRAGPNFSTDG